MTEIPSREVDQEGTEIEQLPEATITTNGGQAADGINRIGDTTIIPRSHLEQTARDEYGARYRCPRCGYDYVTEYCDCPECLWAGMCQVGWA